MSPPGATEDRQTASSLGIKTEAEHLEELLDEALMETFPASDPVAISIERGDGRKPMPQNKVTESTDPNGNAAPR